MVGYHAKCYIVVPLEDFSREQGLHPRSTILIDSRFQHNIVMFIPVKLAGIKKDNLLRVVHQGVAWEPRLHPGFLAR